MKFITRGIKYKSHLHLNFRNTSCILQLTNSTSTAIVDLNVKQWIKKITRKIY